MNDNLSKLMKKAYNHPKSRLSDSVWHSIQIKQAKNLKTQSLLYGFVGFLSLCGFVFMSFSLEKQFSASGFFHYASLAFSDGNILATYWREYLLSLADSFPFASLGASFFLLCSMLISIRKIARQYKYKNQLLIA